jgi:hypothetical protein
MKKVKIDSSEEVIYFFFGAAFFTAATFLAGVVFFTGAALGFVAAPPRPHPQPAIHLTSHLAFKYNYSLSYLNFLL